jgi:hypothetical protein
LAPGVWATVSATRAESRSAASPTQKTPFRNCGTSSAAASSASRVLPEPPRAGEGQQARALPQQLDDLGQLPLPADERGGRPGQVRVRDRPQGRESLAPELEEPERLGEVLQPVLAEVGQLALDKRARRLREEHLAAVPGGGDPRRQVDVRADVALPAAVRAPRVQAHPHPDRAGGQCLLAVAGGRERRGRGRERVEEGVSLGVDLHAATPSERRPQQPPVLGERLLVGLCAQLVQQAGGALDVGEEQGDAAVRKLVRHEP